MKKILGHIFSSIFTIAGLTIREALRKRIIFIILLISSFFLLMNFFCESVTMQANGEEVKDSAIGPIFIFVIVTVWSLVISALVTSSLLADEFENKTYTMILSKPIFSMACLSLTSTATIPSPSLLSSTSSASSRAFSAASKVGKTSFIT